MKIYQTTSTLRKNQQRVLGQCPRADVALDEADYICLLGRASKAPRIDVASQDLR